MGNTAIQQPPETIYCADSKYCSPAPNEIKFISNKQTLFLTLGSCISTVFIGKSDKYFLAANHIVLFKESMFDNVLAKKGGEKQVDEILDAFNDVFSLPSENIICLHLLGGGSRVSDKEFKAHETNVSEARELLEHKGFETIFIDTNSYCSAMYSLDREKLSVFVNNIFNCHHISFVIDLEKLFSMVRNKELKNIPASSLIPDDKGFQELTEKEVIIAISGSRSRLK